VLARQAGIDTDRTPDAELPMRLETMRALIHIDNVDSADAARVVGELLRAVPQNAAIVTGRYTELGTSKAAGWQRVKVGCFDPDDAVAMLRAELGDHGPAEVDLRRLAAAVGGLPLALHLAAGYLWRGYSVEAFLKRLAKTGHSLELVDPADPAWADRCRGVISTSFALSRELFLAEATRRGRSWGPALARLGWTVPAGFERSLGAAFAGLSEDEFVEFVAVASALSLVHRVPQSEQRPDGAWSVHPLLAEFLRAEADRGEVWARVGAWIAGMGAAVEDGRDKRWATLGREHGSVAAWLEGATPAELGPVAPACWQFACKLRSGSSLADRRARGVSIDSAGRDRDVLGMGATRPGGP
jgi:hypothetical protein